MVIPDSLDFVVFFTIDFQRWCFIIQFITPVASKEVDVKNVMKSSQRLALAGCQVQTVSRLANVLQHGEVSNVVILKLPWALQFYVFGGKEDLVTNCVRFST